MTDETFSRKVDNTARLLFEALISPDLEKFGFFQLANRLLMGLQGRYVLRFFATFGFDRSVEFELGSSLLDYIYLKDVLKFSRVHRVQGAERKSFAAQHPGFKSVPAEIASGRTYRFPKDDHKVFSLFENSTDGMALHFRIYNVRSIRQSGVFALDIREIAPNSEAAVFVDDVLRCLRHQWGGDFDVDLKAIVPKSLLKGMMGARLQYKNRFVKIPDHPREKEIFDELQRYNNTLIHDIVQSEYLRLRESPLRRFEELPFRFLFHLKRFNRSEPRAPNGSVDGYHYEPVPIFCEAQRTDLEKGLIYLRDRAEPSSEANSFRFRATKRNAEYRENEVKFITRQRYLDPEVDEWFWSKLKNQGNLDWFFDTICEPLSEHERLFCDPCLASGVVQYRDHVFPQRPKRDHLLPYVFVQSTTLDPRSRLASKYRDVCYHYLFSMMATTKSKPRQDLLLIPTRLGGAPFGCISTVFGCFDDDDELKDVHEPARIFARNWYFYERVAVNFNGHIRRDLMNGYLTALSIVFEEYLSRQLRSKRSTAELLDELNTTSAELQRLLPFDRIVFFEKKHLGQDFLGENVVSIAAARAERDPSVLEHGYMIVPHARKETIVARFEVNQHFSRFGKRQFVEQDHCLGEWLNACQALNIDVEMPDD